VIRRRMAVLLVALFGVIGLLLAPTPSGAGGQSNSKGNGPKETRCDPQPDHGQGPPAGKGTKKCASP
jgi:hypothetical protein